MNAGDGRERTSARLIERVKVSTAPPARHERIESERLPVYRLSGEVPGLGASLGNRHCWVTSRGRGAIDGFFSTDLGRIVTGSVIVRFSGLGSRLVLSGDHWADARQDAYVQLRVEHPGEVVLHPAYERFIFMLPGDLHVQQTIFVPRHMPPSPPGEEPSDPPVAYQLLEIANRSEEVRRLRVYGYAQLRGDTDPDLCTRYDADRGALVACNARQPEWVRVFGADSPVSAYEATTDASHSYSMTQMRPLTNQTACTGGHVLGCLQVDLDLQPGEVRTVSFVLAFSHEGDETAVQCFDAARNVRQALDDTIAFYDAAMQPAEVMTPDAVVNQGALWAKINMLRVMADYPTGPAFTNDPSRSSAVVGRDAFWFIYGCDHLLPRFSCHLLDAFQSRQEPSGEIVEFYDAVTGETDDYGLNINDNTPLFILAVNHHWRSTAHRDCLERHYPAVARAARYIISQEDARGLVWCTATGEELHGIIGWRNIIPHYRISGAVTEVNAECAAALRAAGHLAENLGKAKDAREFREAAKRLTAAINQYLLNPDKGVYYLNIDVDGMMRTDITADEVFPVIFRVAPEEVAFRIVSRLNISDFWTEAGLRTVSTESPDYDASGHWGLLGGVWPGVTWWYAFAAARYHPGAMVRALRASFEHYAQAPKLHNTVPGQFSEWFDGESLANRGMRLSPWEAPRYLWAAVEGICGVMLQPEPQLPKVRPLLPLEWKWVGLRQVPYHGRQLSFFAARLGAPGPGAEQAESQRLMEQQMGTFMQLYASGDIELAEGHAVRVYARDVTERVGVLNEALHTVVFERPGEVLICVGNTATQTSIGTLELEELLDTHKRYRVHLYNSERGAWTGGESRDADGLLRVAVVIESQGFRILRLREAS
jgi:glycogen debranching enzyme